MHQMHISTTCLFFSDVHTAEFRNPKCYDCKAISCFFSVLRQFKIVKPTRQPGEKNNQALKNKVVSACCMNVECNKNFIHFFFSAKEILNKV
jgi:hypothetical protein